MCWAHLVHHRHSYTSLETLLPPLNLVGSVGVDQVSDTMYDSYTRGACYNICRECSVLGNPRLSSLIIPSDTGLDSADTCTSGSTATLDVVTGVGALFMCNRQVQIKKVNTQNTEDRLKQADQAEFSFRLSQAHPDIVLGNCVSLHRNHIHYETHHNGKHSAFLIQQTTPALVFLLFNVLWTVTPRRSFHLGFLGSLDEAPWTAGEFAFSF